VAELLAPFAGPAAGELAERLIGSFGNLARALAAPLPQLRAAAGGHENAVEAIAGARRLVEAAYGEQLAGTVVAGDDPALHRYLGLRLGTSDTERLHAVFADRADRYLADEPIALGTRDKIETRARPLFERALALGAAGFLLAHNHPSGHCRPSAHDLAGTARLADLAEALELRLIDHLIVTRTRVFSMRLGGYL
jgi:DNA repair protein RadC